MLWHPLLICVFNDSIASVIKSKTVSKPFSRDIKHTHFINYILFSISNSRSRCKDVYKSPWWNGNLDKKRWVWDRSQKKVFSQKRCNERGMLVKYLCQYADNILKWSFGAFSRIVFLDIINDPLVCYIFFYLTLYLNSLSVSRHYIPCNSYKSQIDYKSHLSWLRARSVPSAFHKASLL